MTYYIHSEYPNFFFYEKKRKKRKMNSLLDTISICLTINLIVSYKKGTLLSYWAAYKTIVQYITLTNSFLVIYNNQP